MPTCPTPRLTQDKTKQNVLLKSLISLFLFLNASVCYFFLREQTARAPQGQNLCSPSILSNSSVILNSIMGNLQV